MNPITLPAPGLHYGVEFSDYQKWDAVNFSRLKPIRGTASKCKYEIDHPKDPTPAMILGSSLHVATLEPARFESQFFIRPECDRRTKEGKEIYAKAMAEAHGRLMLEDGEEIEALRAMAKVIQTNCASRLFLDCAGQNEVSALWRDAETGLMCKARFDRLLPSFDRLPGKPPVIVEIKSDRNAEPWAFGKTCDDRQYAGQAASYCHAHKMITGVRPAHIFIVVENTPPHDLQVHMLDDQGLQTGMLEYREMLNRYAECERTGIWPGYDEKINVLSLPKWKQ